MRKDLIGSAVLLLIAGAYYIASTGIPATNLEDEVGPRGFPTLLAGLLAVIALALAGRTLLVPRESPPPRLSAGSSAVASAKAEASAKADAGEVPDMSAEALAKEEGRRRDNDEEEAPPLRALGLIAVSAFYIPLAYLLGYVPAIFLLLVAVMFYEGLRPSWRSLLVAAGGALFFWLLFNVVLGVAQPEALLF